MSESEKEFSIINLKDISEPVSKLVDAIGNAIGIIYEPTAIRRKAKADADASLIRAKTDLKINELTERAAQRQKTLILRQQKNIESIVNKSMPLLPNKCSSFEELDADWVFTFFDCCQNCSHEQLQILWAKLLAGEADIPGTFSRRALHTVKMLSTYEANLFTKFCSYTWRLQYSESHSMVGVFQHYSDKSNAVAGSRLDEALRCFDLTSRDMHILQTLGLISLATVIESGSEDSILLDCNEKKYSATPESIGVSVEMMPLSELGLELYPIAGSSPNVEYMNIIFQYLKESGYVVNELETIDR